jgi:hypothetical protein
MQALRAGALSEVVYVVVKYGGWDKDEYIHAYLSRSKAEQHRDALNGEPYEEDGIQPHRVWTIPATLTAPTLAEVLA